ncbi:LacI family DNA-binding transcriptional regulator [Phyllobacterium salinisoli]|uniref:LacI family DNA-binding transcriptional regulator n=1 Tax=Phyllobacterium salinisoli TaxID=1899321 RepID=A0A368K531_9HYPH|nr:LacI family DNA-binding transcriptional regulator [Phyllobacterium salinisoli]RCS24496.1 LacI family DNA-binding transcriptional regulator [Phyllobacterium salinisoli]
MAKINFGKAPTLHDLAQAAGVSKGTASNVFNRPEIVREEVRERVLELAKAMGYRGPDPKGRLLSAGKVNAIGVATVLPLSYFFEDPYARVLMSGITEACDASGTGISLVSAANEEELAWNMQNALVDGFILFCLEGADKLIQSSRERQLPFVALDLGSGDETMSAVGIDNLAGARLAAQHLLDLGHRRFAVLGMPFVERGSSGRVGMEQVNTTSFNTSRDRAKGYFQALEAAGIDSAEVPIYETRIDRETVYPALEEIFSSPLPPSALLAQSDRIAFIALDWLNKEGISVPDDVSIVGFDGVPESAASIPPLTTIQQPIAEIGRRAVRAILDHAGEVWREKIDVELVVRNSTAPLKDQYRAGLI